MALFVFANPTLLPTCLTYKNDVERTCDVEHLSGIAAKGGGPQIMTWLKDNVATPEGVVLVNELSTKSVRDQSIQLRGETHKYGIAACPFADSLDAQAKQDEVAEDMANLCAGRAVQGSSVAVLDIGAAGDDAERLREIRDWSVVNLKTPEAQALVAQIAQRPPNERGPTLRTASGKGGVSHCALAVALDQPLPLAVKPPIITPSFSITKYDGERKYETPATDAIVALGDPINGCYAAGLEGNPRLTGKVAVHVSLDGTGKLKEAKDDGSTLADKRVIKCIVDAIASVAFPRPPSKVSAPKFTVTLTLVTTTAAAPSAGAQ
jgi:hypothetical protein